MQCAHVGLDACCVCAEQEGSQQRLGVRRQLGQDACHKQIHSNGVFQKVFKPGQ